MTLSEKCMLAVSKMGELACADIKTRNTALAEMAAALRGDESEILNANSADLKAASERGMSDSMLDRLRLTHERIEDIACAVEQIISLPDPLGAEREWVNKDGLKIARRKVPFGLIAIIYEARPNVTADAAALCIKSGNAVILRGGSEAIRSNIAIAQSLSRAVARAGLPAECISIVEDTSRETANELMRLKGIVDLLIPRGGKSLIRAVVDNATVPVIETGAGNCHVFFDDSADFGMALDIIDNAKRSRPSVCNAAETLLVHEKIACDILPLVQARLRNVELRGCEKTCAVLDGIAKATDEDFYTEYNDYILSVRVVKGVEDAVSHINKYGTGHSEAIVTQDTKNAEFFCDRVDAAAVYVNASTRFTDGGVFGFGAEIGISTQKMHVRGPMGLDALTTVKYVINGNGQIR